MGVPRASRVRGRRSPLGAGVPPRPPWGRRPATRTRGRPRSPGSTRHAAGAAGRGFVPEAGGGRTGSVPGDDPSRAVRGQGGAQAQDAGASPRRRRIRPHPRPRRTRYSAAGFPPPSPLPSARHRVIPGGQKEPPAPHGPPVTRRPPGAFRSCRFTLHLDLLEKRVKCSLVRNSLEQRDRGNAGGRPGRTGSMTRSLASFTKPTPSGGACGRRGRGAPARPRGPPGGAPGPRPPAAHTPEKHGAWTDRRGLPPLRLGRGAHVFSG